MLEKINDKHYFCNSIDVTQNEKRQWILAGNEDHSYAALILALEALGVEFSKTEKLNA